VKDLKEWEARQKEENVKYIILASFESLNLGISYVSIVLDYLFK
jgi:hypothetical protein